MINKELNFKKDFALSSGKESKSLSKMFHRKIPKREKPDSNSFTYHDPHGEIQNFKRDWSKLTKITAISIDPGVVNLAFRIESRPYKGPVLEVNVKSFENKAFGEFNTDAETGTSLLYRKVTEDLDNWKYLHNEVHIVVIERQLPINYNMVRMSQHVISYFLDRLAGLPLYPLLLEIDSTLKTKMMGYGGALNDSQRKDWSTEMALLLCFFRKDWTSFLAIVNSNRKKADDLSDTIVQLEAVCKYFSWGITPFPQDWIQLSPFSAWQPGLIFFNHIYKLLKGPTSGFSVLSTKEWLDMLKYKILEIQELRDSLALNPETGEIKLIPAITLNFIKVTPPVTKIKLNINSFQEKKKKEKDENKGVVNLEAFTNGTTLQEKVNSRALHNLSKTHSTGITLRLGSPRRE